MRDRSSHEKNAQQYCLKWNNFTQHLNYAFNCIWSNDDTFTDVTLVIPGGHSARAHKLVLSACSNFFRQLLVEDTCDDSVLILHDVSEQELDALVHFMYHGEVNVAQEVIPGLLKAAEALQIRGLCTTKGVAPKQSSVSGSSATGKSSVKRPAASAVGSSAKRSRTGQAEGAGSSSSARGRSVDSEDSRDANGSAAASPAGQSDGEGQEQLAGEDQHNGGLEPETLLAEQGDDGWSQDSGTTDEQLFPLPRSQEPAPETYTATAQLKNLAVRVKLEPKLGNDLEEAIVSSLPKTDGLLAPGPAEDSAALIEEQQKLLAFHEPRPCPHCRKMYRDAATLRTHVSIMHVEGLDPVACSCGSLFRTKHEMYIHKRNGHRT